MLYVDTFGATGGVGRCTIELLPFLARRIGGVTLAGRSHVIDSYGTIFDGAPQVRMRNLEQPRFHPAALALRARGRTTPLSRGFTNALLDRAGIRATNREPVLINYPQVLAPPGKEYEFSILLHDLNWCRYPENFPDPEALDQRCREWVKRATRVFTNSDFTRQEVIELYGTDPARVISAPLAPPMFSPHAANASEDAARLEQFGLKQDGYFFYPSVLGSHKGHDVLAEALALKEVAILPVVITAALRDGPWPEPGTASSHAQKTTAQLQALRKTGKIISLPHLPWTDVMLLARSSRAYVLPSRFEGFGFPLVEAMALKKFSICSDIPPFLEILSRYGAGIRAATFPSGDATELRELLTAHTRTDSIEPGSCPTDPPSSWTWADTAAAIADGL